MSFVLLSLLLQCMLSHGIIPEDMGLETITPISKNKHKSCNDSNNYRAITLSSILGKLVDNIILTQNSSVLSTCDLQFGFKNKHSTVQCSFALKEIVQYYSNNKSNVYCLLLDATQAFDRVHYIKLFNTLTRRGMCSLTVRFLIRLYTQQKLRVKCENTFSPEFCIKNGVKQGGVLSFILFTVYFDELLLELKDSGYGCWIGNTFCGALAYADDVLCYHQH